MCTELFFLSEKTYSRFYPFLECTGDGCLMSLFPTFDLHTLRDTVIYNFSTSMISQLVRLKFSLPLRSEIIHFSLTDSRSWSFWL